MESITGTRGTVSLAADFHAWATLQIISLREGRTGDLDMAGLAECLEGVVARDLASAREFSRRVLVAFAVFEFGPSVGGPSRRGCLAEAVSALHELSSVMTTSVAAILEAEFGSLWAAASARAARDLADLGADPSCIPTEPPFGWKDVFGGGSTLPV